MTTNTTNSQAASIADDIEFWNLIEAYGAARGPATKESAALCAYIDAKLAQAREEGAQGKFDEGYAAGFNAVKDRMVASESRLAEIQRGMEGLTAYEGSDIENNYVLNQEWFFLQDEIKAILAPQGQADTSGLPG